MGIELEDDTEAPDLGDPGQIVFEALRDTWEGLDADTRAALVMSIGGGGPWATAPQNVKDACAELESVLFDDEDDEDDAQEDDAQGDGEDDDDDAS